jgi:hypothetical protein
VLRSAMKAPPSPRGTKAQIPKALGREMGEGVIDYQIADMEGEVITLPAFVFGRRISRAY